MAERKISFTDGELEIMKVVWEKGKATVDDVTNALFKIRQRKYVTILTMMRRLEKKGFLQHQVDNRTYVYTPTVSEKKARENILKNLTRKLFNGSKELLLVNLLESESINPEEISRIKQLITEKERSIKDV